jgi:hypothetical protein
MMTFDGRLVKGDVVVVIIELVIGVDATIEILGSVFI